MAVDLKQIDGLQVLRSVFDPVENRLRTDAQLNGQIGDIEVDVDHTNDSIRLGDGTNFLTSTPVSSDLGLDVYLINPSLTITATDLDIRDLTHTQDSTRLGDGTNLTTTTTIGPDTGLDVNVISDPTSVTTPGIQNISIVAASTEYSVVFAAGTKKASIRVRGNGKLQYSYTSGQTNINYYTIPKGAYKVFEDLELTASMTVYFQSDRAGEVLEAETWA